PVRVWKLTAMRTGVSCWSWLLSERPDMETRVMHAMYGAWVWSIEQGIGLFSPEHGTEQGAEAVYKPDAKPAPSLSRAPNVWIAFLEERFRIVRKRSMSQSQLIGNMVLVALRAARSMNRHFTAVAVKFNLFNLALTLLHGLGDMASGLRVILRQQLFYALLCYMAHAPRIPCKPDLTDELESLGRFYVSLQKDRQLCKQLELTLRTHRQSKLAHLLLSHEVPLTIVASFLCFFAIQGHLRFVRACDLMLVLTRHEADRLVAWHDAAATGRDTTVAYLSEMKAFSKPSQRPSDRTWKEYFDVALATLPESIVFLARRFNNVEHLQRLVSQEVLRRPVIYAGIPEALKYLLNNYSQDAAATARAILSWTPVAPVTALSLLRLYPEADHIVLYALRVLNSFKPDVILFYIPQIVQALRCDRKGYIRDYMLRAAHHSNLLAHQMIWNMKTNVYKDDEAEHRDEIIGDMLEEMIKAIQAQMSDAGQQFYEREFDFFDQVTDVSGRIRDKPLGPKRKAACLEELAKVHLQDGCYLPAIPEGVVVGIDYNSGHPMQSAAKAPYLATFDVIDCTLSEMEDYEASREQLEKRKSHRLSCIFKVGDDVRQDMLALQIMRLFKQVFAEIQLDVALFPYRVVATAPGCGVIECVPNAKSRDQLGRATNANLHQYFLQHYGNEDTVAFQSARRNFIRSMAAYSIIGFLLQIKDRHNGNIMVDDAGHLIHIDFGFMFESSPGGNIGFEPDLKLTREMADIMGGDRAAEPFKWFLELCVRCYLAVRPMTEQIISLVELMLDTGLPCFRTNKILQHLRARFQPQMSDAEAAIFIRDRIYHSYLNTRTYLYDVLQAKQNSIAY
ncbi:uncharacterized protein MONBRDRAFT_169, partial [Monosiga brevicollis MX1]